MKTSTRVGLTYLSAVALAGGVSWLRKKRAAEVAVDAALYGLAFGTVANVTLYFAAPAKADGEARPNGVLAFLNGKSEDLGKLSSAAVSLLNQIDGDQVFAANKKNGVKVAEVPEQASMITQDA